MLEQWYLDSVTALPRAEFDVKRALRELEDFVDLKNKNRGRFEELLANNGLAAIEQDMILMGRKPTMRDLVGEAQKKNTEAKCRIIAILSPGASSSEEDEEETDYDAEREMLDYLERERRYWARFLTVYNQLTPLEKIAIGRSNEVGELSMEMLTDLLEQQFPKRPAAPSSSKRGTSTSSTLSFPANLTSLAPTTTCKTDSGERRFSKIMVFSSGTKS